MLVPIATKLKWRLPRAFVIRPLPALPFSSPPSPLLLAQLQPNRSYSDAAAGRLCLPGTVLNVHIYMFAPSFSL